MNTVQELNFTRKVRRVLNQELDTIPQSTAERLAAARHMALSRKKSDAPAQVLAARWALVGGPAGHFSDARQVLLGRMVRALPFLILMAGLIGIFQYEQQQYLDETADIEVSMLSDDLPVAAYADQGFNAYLADYQSDTESPVP